MSFWIDISDLAHIVVPPNPVDNGTLAWHGGRLLQPLQIAKDDDPNVWQLRDAGPKLTDARTRGLTALVAADATGRY